MNNKSSTGEMIVLVEKPGLKERVVAGLIGKLTRPKIDMSAGAGASSKKQVEEQVQKSVENSIDNKIWGVQMKNNTGEFIWRHANFADKLMVGFRNYNTLIDMFLDVVDKYKDRPFLGVRSVITQTETKSSEGHTLVKQLLSEYHWRSYGETKAEVQHYASYLKSIGIGKHKHVAIFADTHAEWLITALSCLYINSHFNTIYSTLSDEAIIYAIDLTQTDTLFVDEKSIHRIIPMLSRCPTISNIILSSNAEKISETFSKQFASDKMPQLHHYSKVLKTGKKLFTENNIKPLFTEPNELAFIMFTSGSTGMPKGVMLSNLNILSTVAGASSSPEFWLDHTYAAFLPLAHIFEFLAEMCLMAYGAQIGYCKPLTLTDTSPMVAQGGKGDLTMLKPTVMTFVPLLAERIKKGIIEVAKKKGSLPAFILQQGYNSKVKARGFGVINTPKMDKVVFKNIRNVVGGRLRWGIIGSAPLSQNTEEFLNVCLGVPLKQGYGLTETASGVSLGDLRDITIGHVGPPFPVNEVKLEPWPEGGYSPTDKPNPRGEILVSGANICLGYYKRPDITNEVIKIDERTNKRWFYTGDIGEMLPNGTLKIIDRKKDIIKLEHGEYISLVQLEALLVQSPLVEMLCLLPDRANRRLILFVVPSREAVLNLANELKEAIPKNFEQLLVNDAIKNRILDSLIKICRKRKFSKFETPQKFVIVSEYWTPESGLVTPSMKVKRVEIAKFYSSHLD